MTKVLFVLRFDNDTSDQNVCVNVVFPPFLDKSLIPSEDKKPEFDVIFKRPPPKGTVSHGALLQPA